MKTASRLLISLCLGLTSAQVHLPFSRHEGHLGRVARRDTTQLSLHASDFVYVTNISVGTPPQPFQVILSQSTGDTWVPDATDTYCDTSYYTEYYADDPDYLAYYTGYCAWGSFNKTISSTYAAANVMYSSFYSYTADGSYVSGDNFTDTLKVGDITLDNYAMGLVDDADTYIGVLGLGQNRSYSSSYSTTSSKYTYLHFLDRLVSTGKISTAAYSIWLDDAEGSSGNLLLGAIDTSRFEGTLTRLSAYQSSSYVQDYTFAVEITGLNGTDKSSNPLQALTGNDLPLPVAIDTGSALSMFPSSLATKIWTLAGATYNTTVRAATIPCAADGSAQFTLQLGGDAGPVLDVQLTDLILSPKVLQPRYSSYMKSTPSICVFGVQNTSSSSSSSGYGYSSLGSSLLRRSYLVFDTENLEVAIAPVKFAASNPGTSTVVPFPELGAVAPSATMYCGTTNSYYCQTTCTANCNPTSTGSRGSGTGSNSGSGSSNSGYASGMPDWEQAAIGVGVTFGVIALVAIGIAVVLWRRALTKRKEISKEVDEESFAGPEMTGARGPPEATDEALPTVAEEQPESFAPQLPPLPPREQGLDTHVYDAPREPSSVSETLQAVASEDPPRSPKGKEPVVIPAHITEEPPAPPAQTSHETRGDVI